MTKTRAPLAWRLVLWFSIFAVVPLLAAYSFVQGQVRDAYIEARLDTLENQVRLYSTSLELNPGAKQSLTVAMTNSLQETDFFLLGVNGLYIAHTDPDKIGKPALRELGVAVTRQLLSNETVAADYEAYASETLATDYEENGLLIASFRRSINDPVAVSITRWDNTSTPLGNLTYSIIFQLGMVLLGMALALGLVMLVMMGPARQLTEFAGQLGNRNFLATLNLSKFKGELGLIAGSLMGLSAKIQKMIKDLEQEVLDRTKALEKRAVQLRAAADVGKAITSVRVLSELLQQTTQLISERFGYYHVGIFLLDERKEYAVLSASNSEGGRKMLERNHRLKVGETGIVGYVTENAKARIALDVGQDAVFFDNPDLPNTRSEMALPMVVSGKILGALDVQSTEPQAFNEEDIATLQILAEQIAVAIQNVNLLNETENALEAARQVYGEVSREAWRKILRYQQRVGYLATSPGAIQTQSETMDPNMAKAFETGDIVFGGDGLTIILPIKVRGESIGAIRLKKSEISETWSQDETNLAIALADQLSGALESARLYRASQQIAARQSLVSDISARISARSRVENVVKETVQELGQILGNSKITFQVQGLPGGSEQAEGHARSVVKSRKNGGSKE